MKIFIDGYIYSLQSKGGISRIYDEIIPILTRDNSVVLFSGINFSSRVNKSSQYKHVGLNLSQENKLIRVCARYINILWMNILWIVYYFKGYRIFLSSYYRIPVFRHATKIIVMDYDCVPERYPELFPGSTRLFNTKRKAFYNADQIATISYSSKKDLIKYYSVNENKIKVFYLGINETFLSTSNYYQQQENKYLLFVGSRAPYKNFALLSKIFIDELSDHYDLRIVGGGDLKADHPELHRNPSVYYHQPTDLELKNLYINAAALIYPSAYEGFGLPPIEAMSCSCPVVLSSNNAATKELVGDHAYYFMRDVPEDLKKIIAEAVLMPESKRKLAMEHAKKFTWENTYIAFKSILDTI